MKVFVFACLVAIAIAAPAAKPDFDSSEEIIIPQPYQFSHQVADDDSTNYQSRVETQDEDGVVSGQYSFVGPNGIRYTTTYTADAVNGFQAHTDEEQTDIKIVFPERYDSDEFDN
ncbi:unnamed protein product [Meganyctiphanes norvegica]|uniref:Cuticle protein n=1 Tax=Meganyctiphanes norvegica TaxID=48144 RepID=A0AAV2RDT4_MEGNR